MNKEFKRRLCVIIGVISFGFIFILGFAPKDSDPKDLIPGISIVKETDPHIIGSYFLRYERFNVISDQSDDIIKARDIPCLSLQNITPYWDFNVLTENYGYHWVVRESFFAGRCLTLVKK
jgi:hypothetical protein